MQGNPKTDSERTGSLPEAAEHNPALKRKSCEGTSRCGNLEIPPTERPDMVNRASGVKDDSVVEYIVL
jgi:hypothetical protein